MNDRSGLRLIILGVLVFSLPITLLGRLWYMQALAGSQYVAAVNADATSVVRTLAPRGAIVDDVGNPLARNDSALVVSALSTALPKANLGTLKNPITNPARVQEMQRLSSVLGIPADQLDATATLCDYFDYGSAAPTKNKGCWTGSPLQPIPLVTIDNTTPAGTQKATQVALRVLEQQELYPGVTAQIEEVRNYPAPDNASAAQLIGHVGKISQADIDSAKNATDSANLKTAASIGGIVGQEGLEAEYNDYLEGTLGTETFSVTPAGNPVSTISQVPAVPGDTVVTSIDARVQRIAEQAIADAVTSARTTPQFISGKNQTQKADTAAAVVIDTRTGHVIAAANYPSYDPGVWDGGAIDQKIYQSLQDNPGKPLFSQAIQGQYAPGSTFKVVTTAAALDHGGYTPDATYDCPATLSEGGRTFHNFDNEGAQGMITFAQALTISCDTFFDGVGAALWNADGQLAGANAKELVVNEAKQWKLGQDTGIDLPIDASGNIEDRQDLKNYDAKNHALWCSEAKTDKDPNQKAIDTSNCLYHIPGLYQIGDAVNVAIGQGTTTASPLQMADIYAALGNGGTLYSPRLAKAIVGPDGKLVQTINAPSTKLQVSPEVLQYIQQALVGVVTDPNGTGAAAFANFPFDQYTVAGKTGTAEVPPKDDTSWFASYGGPVGQPAQYAVVVMISQGGQGGITAAPAVRQIYDGIWGLNGNPKNPDDQFAAHGPALPGGAPPSALPKVAQVAGASAAPASPGVGSTSPSSPSSPTASSQAPTVGSPAAGAAASVASPASAAAAAFVVSGAFATPLTQAADATAVRPRRRPLKNNRVKRR
jgi:penicillin-binding protein 2